MVYRARSDPAFRAFALSVVRGCGGRDLVCQLTVLRAWLQSRFRFVRDPYGVELVYSPERQVDMFRRQGYIEGDCDDAAVLAAALAQALGFRVRFKLLSFFNLETPSHIYTEALGPYGWVEFDVTRPPRRPIPTAVKDVDL
jgi:transglutaminase-like putative cysteine protease